MIRCIRIGVWVKYCITKRGQVACILASIFFLYSIFPFFIPFIPLCFRQHKTEPCVPKNKERKEAEEREDYEGYRRELWTKGYLAKKRDMTLVVTLSWFACAAIVFFLVFFPRRMYEMTFRPRHGIRTRGGLYGQDKRKEDFLLEKRAPVDLNFEERWCFVDGWMCSDT